MTDDLRTRAREAAEWLYPEPQYASLTYPHGAVRGYMRVAFIKGALWHAAQQPTLDVDELAAVIDRADDDWQHGIGASGTTWDRAIAHAVRDYLTGDESDE